MKIFFASIFCLCITNIYARSNQQEHTYQYDYKIISTQVTNQAIKTICYYTELIPTGLGDGMIDCIYQKHLNFELQRSHNKRELRKVAVESMEIYTRAINSCKEIRPFLSEFPFNPENVTITVFIVGSDGRALRKPNIGVITIFDGIVSYRTYSEGAVRGDTVATESYETAREIAYAERFGYVCDDTPSDDHP